MTVRMNKPDFLEKTNELQELFLKKLRLGDAVDNDFPYWLSSAALDLCVILKNAELREKLTHAKALVKAVKDGFKRDDLLYDLSSEDEDLLTYSKDLFTKMFPDEPEEIKTLEATRVLEQSEEKIVQEGARAKETQRMIVGKYGGACTKCRKSLKILQILPCSHAFCIRCLVESGGKTNKNPGEMAPCGVCGENFEIPKGGFYSLENSTSSTSYTRCGDCAEACGSDGATEIPPAVIHCFDCDQYLCAECRRYHNKNKLLKTHNVLDLEDPLNTSAALRQLTSEENPDEMKKVDVEGHSSKASSSKGRRMAVASGQSTKKEKSDEPPEKYTCEVSLFSELTIRIERPPEKNNYIRGLAILQNRLFVVSDESSEVEIYDSTKFTLRRRWNLKELICPMDIASCNRNTCLYIFDYKGRQKSKEILRVNPDEKFIKKWSTGSDWGKGLSVTDESNVILALYEESKLNEYSPDGELIRTIILPEEVINPLHAIKLANDDFLVSHGFHKRDLHRVFLVDAGGKLKKSFGGKSGKTLEQMNCPSHLAVDENGFVMVADRRNGRVLLLDSDLRFKQEIVSKAKNESRWPWKILLDESNDQLFVAENWGRRCNISIFSLRR